MKTVTFAILFGISCAANSVCETPIVFNEDSIKEYQECKVIEREVNRPNVLEKPVKAVRKLDGTR